MIAAEKIYELTYFIMLDRADKVDHTVEEILKFFADEKLRNSRDGDDANVGAAHRYIDVCYTALPKEIRTTFGPNPAARTRALGEDVVTFLDENENEQSRWISMSDGRRVLEADFCESVVRSANPPEGISYGFRADYPQVFYMTFAHSEASVALNKIGDKWFIAASHYDLDEVVSTLADFYNDRIITELTFLFSVYAAVKAYGLYNQSTGD